MFSLWLFLGTVKRRNYGSSIGDIIIIVIIINVIINLYRLWDIFWKYLKSWYSFLVGRIFRIAISINWFMLTDKLFFMESFVSRLSFISVNSLCAHQIWTYWVCYRVLIISVWILGRDYEKWITAVNIAFILLYHFIWHGLTRRKVLP